MDSAKIIENCEIALIELNYALADYATLECENVDKLQGGDLREFFPALRAARVAALVALEAVRTRVGPGDGVAD